MTIQRSVARTTLTLASAVAASAISYGAYAAFTWMRYGKTMPPDGPYAIDPLLDQFMPVYEVVERHHIRVNAPAAITFDTMKESDLSDSAVVRAIFKAREVALRAQPDGRDRPRGLIAQTCALGWRPLAEVPGREIVMGAVTQPWLADVVFRGLSPEEFASFNEAGYVKIIWTLRADPITPSMSEAITETRVVTTDAFARSKFRRYWSYVSPGVELIRRLSLRVVRRDAERRYRSAGSAMMKIVPPRLGTSM
jgi:hypothetical protein